MVVDSSALLAIVSDEPEARQFSGALLRATDPLLSNVAFVECAQALVDRFGAVGATQLDHLVHALGLRRVPVDDALASAAADCCRSFGSGPAPAWLDAGGWISCALAHTLDRPLLFKGGDFLRTDVAVAC
ncbi:type II toxin-antitoxin system VapC family toxin [Conexibacter sp. JD483]|uniref:type II toxin-antitoxin system VapC family toxin n=1 Tax=unclassified Conexibacter TaxID=2627773 RepID=UPI002728F0D8|nr:MULTISPECIES: type II toxin-antitoxin system VapC family toxin [unclassified Conexibacter]MDO8185496.1 type II toxin-antitoxin system VapC family toxin [Conexibacter sp. CPCC 205706]MDO8197317.1 type II toxin-antitoxin system VapC family toxin [Conexibacter sp. CPCC 205762]MDR9370183.1 type II toxin-antitoxin system VapC family toxin [Conexibacter sp. JD483]